MTSNLSCSFSSDCWPWFG